MQQGQKNPISVGGSSKPIYVNMLNGNNFFTLDSDLSKSTNPEPKHSHAFDRRFNMTVYRQSTEKVNLTNKQQAQGVKSAQYSRNYRVLSPNRFRISLNLYHPSDAHKKQSKPGKKTIQNPNHQVQLFVLPKTLDAKPSKAVEFAPRKTFVVKKSQNSKKKHMKALSFALSTNRSSNQQTIYEFFENTENFSDKYYKKSLQPNKNIAQFYKNRRKLTQRVGYSKNSKGISTSPPKWQQTSQKQNGEQPQETKLFLQSISGNKIKYSQEKQDPELRKRKKKIKLSEILSDFKTFDTKNKSIV